MRKGVPVRAAVEADTGPVSEEPERRRRAVRAAVGVVVAVVLAGWSFAVLDVVIAAGVAIVLVTAVGVTVAASGWDQHSTFEERELARARRRQEKWDRNAGARERDRLKWEAHHARRAERPDGGA